MLKISNGKEINKKKENVAQQYIYIYIYICVCVCVCVCVFVWEAKITIS